MLLTTALRRVQTAGSNLELRLCEISELLDGQSLSSEVRVWHNGPAGRPTLFGHHADIPEDGPSAHKTLKIKALQSDLDELEDAFLKATLGLSKCLADSPVCAQKRIFPQINFGVTTAGSHGQFGLSATPPREQGIAMGEAFLFPRQWQAFGRACHLLKNSGDWGTGPKWQVVFQRNGTPSLFDSSNTTVSLRAPTAQRAGELAAVTKFHQILQKPKNWTMRVLSEAEVTPPTSDFTAPGAWPKRDKQHLDIFGQSYDDIPF